MITIEELRRRRELKQYVALLRAIFAVPDECSTPAEIRRVQRYLLEGSDDSGSEGTDAERDR